MDALALAETCPAEEWEVKGDSIDHIAHHHHHHTTHTRSPPKRATPDKATPPPFDAETVASVFGNLDSLDELVAHILRGAVDSTPRRDRSECARLVEGGVCGPVTDVAYPALAPRPPAPHPASSSRLAGILGPDVSLAPADGHNPANVVLLLPCATWLHAMDDTHAQDVTVADAVCVAVHAIPSPDAIRVFGDPSTRIPFLVRCTCKQNPCLVELPANWATAACDLDDPALSDAVHSPASTLLHSSRFGPDAEGHRRHQFLASTRTRPPLPGDLLGPDSDAGEPFGATVALAGTGTLWEEHARHTRARDTLHATTRSLSRAAHHAPGQSFVNEARSVLGGRVRVSYEVHRVWAGEGEGSRSALEAQFPGRRFGGVAEVYAGKATVTNVPPPPTNPTAHTKALVGMRFTSPSSPVKGHVVSRMARGTHKKSTATARTPAQAKPQLSARSSSSENVSVRSEAPLEAASWGMTVDPTGHRYASIAELAGATSSAIPPPSTDVTISVHAIGCCDLDADVGWAEYRATDPKGRVLWTFSCNGRDPQPFTHACLPNPELLIPLLIAIDAAEALGVVFELLCHAAFPARTDPMWHYIRRFQDWERVSECLFEAAQRIKHRVTLDRLDVDE